MRRAARVDANQGVIVDALRAAGAFVQSLAAVGSGCPDLLVAKGRRWMLLEVKEADGKLTPDQKTWHSACHAPVVIVRTIDEALAALRYWTA